MNDPSGWAAPGQPPPPGGHWQPADPPPPGYGPRFGPLPAAKPGVIPLRPLGLGEILDGAISYIRAHPRATLGLSAVVITLTQLIQVPAQYLLVGDLAALDPATGPVSVDEVAEILGGSLATTSLGLLISFVTITILTGLLIIVLSRAVLGQPISLGEAWAAARPRVPGLLGLSLLTGLIVSGVLVVGIAPAVVAGLAGAPVAVPVLLGLVLIPAAVCLAVYLGVALSMATPTYMLERTGVLAALGRSRRLVAPSWWRVFGILVLASLISAAIGAIISVPFTLAGGFAGVSLGADTDPLMATSLVALVIGAVGTIIATTITAPFTAGVTGLLYFDQRIRREALDLELARAAAAPPPPVQ